MRRNALRYLTIMGNAIKKAGNFPAFLYGLNMI